jgi:DNA end-binding protein Ku
MPLRSIATGSLSFGLVSIAVKLFSTRNSSSEVRFHWLHDKCGTRVKQQYFCPKDEEVVERSQLVRGFEKGKGRYVKVSEEELEGVKAKARDAIDVLSFVPATAIDPMLYESTYFLAPDRGGAKGYQLLVKALEESDRVAVGQHAARGNEHLVCIRSVQGALVLHQLHYADEVRSLDELPERESVKVSARELELAHELIHKASEDEFDPAAFKDEVKAGKRALIARKEQEGEVAEDEVGEAKSPGQVIDLMEALKASLARGSQAARPSSKPTRRAKTSNKTAATAARSKRSTTRRPAKRAS